MSTELFLNFLGIRMDSRKAEGLRFTINLVTPDNGEKFIIEMENATLTNIAGFQAAAPDLTLTINRADLEQTMMGAKTLEAQIADGTAKVEGDVGSWRSSPRPWSTSTRASRSCPGPSRRPKSWRRSIPTRRVRSSPLLSSLPAPPTSRARPSPSSADFDPRAFMLSDLSLEKNRAMKVGRAPCHAASRLSRSGTRLDRLPR